MALNNKTRFEQGSRGAWLGIIGNLSLAVLKGVVGVTAGSKAMLADALHSAADLTGSLVVLVAMRVASRPADQCHPYGHGKAESVAAAFIGLLLMVTGARIAWAAGEGLIRGTDTVPGVAALYVGLLSIAVKEGMFQYKIRLGRKLSSPALTANAWEHRSDAYTSVAAVLGIGGARLGYPFLDALTGIVVALVVSKIGLDLSRQAVAELMDRVPEEELLQELQNLAASVPGVEEVQRVWLRPMGGYLLADLTIAVSGNLSVREGHAVAAAVQEVIQSYRADIIRVFVHVNPL